MMDKLIISVFIAVEAAHAFSAFMPSYFTIRKFVAPGDLQALRSGYVPAVGFSLLLGAVVSRILKSPLPLALGALVSLGMVSLYEYAIKQGQQQPLAKAA